MHEDRIAAAVRDPKFLRRFWSKVRKTDGCWEWTAGKSSEGYGSTVWCEGAPTFRKISLRSHRVALCSAVGQIAPHMIVCHRCSNPACCRPDHLYAGTHSDNMRDCLAIGASNRPIGERNSKARFTADDVRMVRALAESGESHKAIARTFGVNASSVDKIVARKTWKHV